MLEIPEGLGVRASGLWVEVVDGYELRADEVELLTELVRTVDHIEQLMAAASPAVVDGQVNPVVRELRFQRQELRHLAAALGLPDETGQTTSSGNSVRARRAAETRWRKEQNHAKDQKTTQ